MSLSDAQVAAALEAQRLLANVGLTTPTNPDDPNFLEVTRVISQTLPAASASAAVRGSLYRPPPGRPFTAEELRLGLDCINRQTHVNAFVEHPLGSIVEYPETGAGPGLAIAHRFSVDPSNFSPPKESFQYSLGDSHGENPYVHCGTLLMGPNGTPASCVLKKFFCSSCKGLKYCSARNYASPPSPFQLDALAEAKKEVFFKTLRFYCTLAEKGCAFDLRTDGEDISSAELTDDPDPDSDSDESESETHTKIMNMVVSLSTHHILSLDPYRHRCEHRIQTDKAHLILRTLDEFDITYLGALLENNTQVIDEREELARQFGYAYWHRTSGKLARGVLQRSKGNCTTTFNIYTPYDLFDCPYVVVTCRNPHSHSLPPSVKTPPPLLEVFRSLLIELEWKLADATPRKLMIDSGFMGSLSRALGWNKPFDPPLAALHPSFGNLDHVRRYIDELRHVLFPSATGFEGAELLAAPNRNLPAEEQYVRCAETHTIEDGKTFQLVICMLRSMSALLVRSKKISLDTAFKRLNGKWQEFEMETWELSRMKSVIGTRAFTTSQSAQAHLILFTRIFEIAYGDTGIPCRFRHIHGEGFEIWITDAHKGQALGAGMFCQRLCAELGEVYCPMEPTRLLRALDPYDHLRRFLRLCTTHTTSEISTSFGPTQPKRFAMRC
ncbi:hypothetical protein B0H17DRAFT_1270949 [Mycena rosella]|uniref:Uncharacterized protein n=1 Tax=Mycena rosella TaxID=1033263 RepID=A0AAD7FXW4_MYCRO|nr:hypothetical protein B0H17DRAFT_1270949 [Mycena rosella]